MPSAGIWYLVAEAVKDLSTTSLKMLDLKDTRFIAQQDFGRTKKLDDPTIVRIVKVEAQI